MTKYHYTYLLTCEAHNLHYIGVRSSVVEPEQDTGYMSSSKLVQFMMSEGVKFTKSIIETFDSREEANRAEQESFEASDAVKSLSFLNLNGRHTPYTKDNSAIKMQYFQQFLPNNSEYRNDLPEGLTAEDMMFCVHKHKGRYHFINHPDYLKHFYATTKTKTYWPGRADRLLSSKDNKTYITFPENVTGSYYEQILQLLDEHYVSGQKHHIAEMIAQLVKTITATEWRHVKQLVNDKMKDHPDRIKTVRNGWDYKLIKQPVLTKTQLIKQLRTATVINTTDDEKREAVRAIREKRQNK